MGRPTRSRRDRKAAVGLAGGLVFALDARYSAQVTDGRTQLRTTLEGLPAADLKRFATAHRLPAYGSRRDLAGRLAEHFDSLEEFLRATDTTEGWNDYLQKELFGSRKRSFSDIAAEMYFCVTTGIPRMRAALIREDNPSVATVRNTPAVCHRVAQILEKSPSELRAKLESQPGGKRVSTLLEELCSAAPAEAESPLTDIGSWSTKAKTRPQLRVGTVLSSRFELVRHLGDGGFGSAYLATDQRTGVKRVLKFANTADGQDALLREYRFGAEIAHRHLCRYLHLDEDPTHGTYLLLEDGGDSLHQRFNEAPAALTLATQVLNQAAEALDYLHAKGVVHADVSPGNILIDHQDDVRIADFGVSTNLKPAKSRATAGATEAITRIATSLIGVNNRFSAPEVLGQQNPRPASDQTSLALSLCAILQGTAGFIRRPRFSFPVLRKGQVESLKRAMAHNPKDRFPSCRDFAREFTLSDANTTAYEASTTRRRR